MENDRLKTSLFKVFQILLGVVLLGKVLHFIVHLPDPTNRVLNATMFSLIGIAYAVMAWVWKPLFTKLVIVTCALFLVGMNFFSANTTMDIIAIVCLLIPMLIARFNKSVNDKANNSDTQEMQHQPVKKG